ncbi:unnamed protein product [Rhizoctonia solani]|uniref:CBM1 domain-containing protein n=1 Tax=Rhizoctonia solani TaxID=456999 RepID=A0A8H3H393_9AGAM|nr:unnamed protein product [Rhizoctonia solani]
MIRRECIRSRASAPISPLSAGKPHTCYRAPYIWESKELYRQSAEYSPVLSLYNSEFRKSNVRPSTHLTKLTSQLKFQLDYSMHPYLYLIALLAQIMPAYTQSNTDVPIGGMCGGLGWSGLTTCVAGGWCRPVNESYSTCEPVPPTPDPAHTNPITETVSWTYSSVTQTWPPSVSCNHYARDEHKRWTCAPSSSTISTTATSTTTITSVSCKNYARDANERRWTCAPSPSATSQISEDVSHITAVPTIT